MKTVKKWEVDMENIGKVKTKLEKGEAMTESSWDEEVAKSPEVSFWGGSLTDVKEIKTLVPPTKNVKLQITGHTIFDTYENGDARNWKQILINFKIVDGIDVAGEIKYKGTGVKQVLPYFANPGNYDYSKPFFDKGQFLVPLTQIVKATGVTAPSLIKGGLTDEAADKLGVELKGKMLVASILQTQSTVKDEETGKYVPTGDLVNEVKFFKALPESSLV